MNELELIKKINQSEIIDEIWMILANNSQTENICRAALEKDSRALAFVKNQNEQFCVMAIKKDWRNLQYIQKQNESIIWTALIENPLALKYVKNQSIDMCVYCVSINVDSYVHVKVIKEPALDTVLSELLILKKKENLKNKVSRL